MDGNIRWGISNVLGVWVVSQIVIAVTDWVTLWFASKNIPGVSHLALGWQTLIHLPSSSTAAG